MYLKKLKDNRKMYRKKGIKEKCSESKTKYSVLTTLLGDVNKLTAGGNEVEDKQVLSMIQKAIKTAKENQILYAESDNASKADEMVLEVITLEELLPNQLSEEKLHEIIVSLVEELGESKSMRDMGKIMGHLNTSFEGQFEKPLASKIAKELILS